MTHAIYSIYPLLLLRKDETRQRGSLEYSNVLINTRSCQYLRLSRCVWVDSGTDPPLPFISDQNTCPKFSFVSQFAKQL